MKSFLENRSFNRSLVKHTKRDGFSLFTVPVGSLN